MSKSLELDAMSYVPRSGEWRLAAAAMLRGASRRLARLAHRLAARAPTRVSRRPAVLEFHAEAGAEAGALYVDGRFVGYVPGVTRL